MQLKIQRSQRTGGITGNTVFFCLDVRADYSPDEQSYIQKYKLGGEVIYNSRAATAGLGALFVPLADKHIKIGGRIAFVLPVALATGEAWSPIRKFITDRYHLEMVITSHDAERQNFSENTDLSEILFVARRLAPREKSGTTNYINLWRNPRSIHEALDLATRLQTNMEGLKDKVGEGAVVRSGDTVLGEITSLSAPTGTGNWTGAIFAQGALMQVNWELDNNSCLKLPGEMEAYSVPLTHLDQLGVLGYDVRDIVDAFDVDKTGQQWSPHPAFWNHDADTVVSVKQKPNATLLARSVALPGRNLKSADAVWSKAGHILLVSRLRTNTHRVIATTFEKKVLGNTWWAFDDSNLTEKQRKSLVLWLNSTFAILLYYGRRAITQGAWMQMKKPAWASMPVLNVRSLSSKQLKIITDGFDAVADKRLEPLAQLHCDPIRREIDRIISEALELPDISSIRDLLAREPGLSAKDINSSDEDEANDLE